MVAKFLDIEREFGTNVAVRTLIISDRFAVFTFQLGELNRGGGIDGMRVADGITQIVRESADGEGIFIDGAGILQKPYDEITGARVMGQVAKEDFAEGVVSHVLDKASAIGVSVRLVELRFGSAGKFGKQQGANRAVPSEVDQFFVSENGIGEAVCGTEQEQEQQNSAQ